MTCLNYISLHKVDNYSHNKLTGLASGGLDEPTITLIITIVIAIITAAVFIIRLEFRVKDLENNSFLAAFKEVQRRQAVDAAEKLLKEWRKKKE
jgi:hypothetical protein